jgi:hypothetical protein
MLKTYRVDKDDKRKYFPSTSGLNDAMAFSIRVADAMEHVLDSYHLLEPSEYRQKFIDHIKGSFSNMLDISRNALIPFQSRK